MSIPQDSDADESSRDARFWRRWLATFLVTVGLPGVLLYVSVVLIDPFSTGRFALTQAIDIASHNPRLIKGAVARDPRFDAAVFGSSTGYPLDPQKIGAETGWTVAQLAVPAALPTNQLVVARAFQRPRQHHGNLQIHVLDALWCRPSDPDADPWGTFPNWIYESTGGEYLSRIFFPESVASSARRLAIWAGLAVPHFRSDGFVVAISKPIPRKKLMALARPTANPAPGAGFPALELLARHVARLPEGVSLAFVFAPPFVNTLPVTGSAADARLRDCKARVRQIADSRPNSAYLDLMAENAITREPENYFDELHYTPAAADAVAAAIVKVLKGNSIVKRKLALALPAGGER